MFPRWLTWIVLIGLGYIMFTGLIRSEQQVASPAVETPAREYPALQELVDGERWKKAVNPDYEALCGMPEADADKLAPFAVTTVKGNGVPAECGDDITATLVQWKPDGTRLRVMEDASVVLGDQKGMDGLLLGIKPGEERLVSLTAAADFTAFPMLKKGQRYLLTVHRTDGVPPADKIE